MKKYIEWIDDKAFLIDKNPLELSDEGYELSGFDWFEKPLKNLEYNSVLYYHRKDSRGSWSTLVFAKRVWNIDEI